MRSCLRRIGGDGAVVGGVRRPATRARRRATNPATATACWSGLATAPVQLEIFCEPQCPHCAELESTYGDRIAGELASGRLAVTYRWLTFLDDRHHNDVSARVSQCAVSGGRPDDLADGVSGFRARPLPPPEPRRPEQQTTSRRWPAKAGCPTRWPTGSRRRLRGRYRRAQRRQQARLDQVNPENPGTPTVYDLKAKGSSTFRTRAGWTPCPADGPAACPPTPDRSARPRRPASRPPRWIRPG